MNALIHPKTGYARPDASLRPMRSIEYEALARVTRSLSVAWPARKADFGALARALNDNLSLWATLAEDVAAPGNGLPPPLRAQIFYLYEFTAHHSQAILKASAGVEPLIDINMAVMRGLRGQGGAA